MTSSQLPSEPPASRPRKALESIAARLAGGGRAEGIEAPEVYGKDAIRRIVRALPAVERVCVLVVDGLGWELLREHPAAAPFLSELAVSGRPLTAGFPAKAAVDGSGTAAVMVKSPE